MKTKVDPQTIAKLRELLEQATPRPWAWQPTGEKDASWSIGLTEPPFAGGLAYGDHYYEPIEHVAWGEGSFADPALIAAAVNALPDLLDDLEEANEDDQVIAERDARESQIERIHAAFDDCEREWTNLHDLGECAARMASAASESNDTLKAENARLRAEVERLQSELDEMRNGRDAAMSAAEALRTHLDALRKENG